VEPGQTSGRPGSTGIVPRKLPPLPSIVVEEPATKYATQEPDSPEYAPYLDHPKRMWDFACEVFEPKLETICYYEPGFDPTAIVKRFGKNVKGFRTWSEPERSPGYEYLIAEWDYGGMAIVTATYMTLSSGPRTWLKSISITSPDYQLKHGLRVGMPYAKFLEVLGRPHPNSKRQQNGVIYYQDSTFVQLTINQKDRVTKVVVSYGHH
jgi:hypothetical protein